jgi:hypothetical protein
LAAAAVILGVFVSATSARAQFVVYSSPAVLAPTPVVSYYTPVTTYPVTSYYAPAVTSYYSPAVTYSYYPPTTVYSAPTVVTPTVVTPTVVAPGTITTRTFTGYGIFRPRGVYTQSYYTPGAVVAPTTTYYSPVIIR